ncbi:MAG TPA: nuclear transport factor 2 family protein [Caulobacteraceae bacterium]|jgi:hypothetical protein|nr:nuclear transport factor 2 family protein [Caulobacteraceae bacterium]
MRQTIKRAAYAAVAALGIAGGAHSAAFPEAALRAANASEVKDFLAADDKALAALWAESFVVTNPLNQLVTKAQVLAMVSSGKLRFSAYDRTLDYVRAYDDIAIIAGSETVRWSGAMPLAGKVSHLRFTAVWRRAGGRWLEIARHANIVPDR